jgi:predicted transcriptional regulator
MKNLVRQKLSRKFFVYDMNDNFISEEFGISEFARKNNFSASSIVKVLNGKRKYTKGYKFNYNKL